LIELKSQKRSPSDDFVLGGPPSPLFKVLGYLEVIRLSPALQGMYKALESRTEPLTAPQEELLCRILEKIGHPEWLEPVLQELQAYISAWKKYDEECSTPFLRKNL
jgi:hypothetical protein